MNDFLFRTLRNLYKTEIRGDLEIEQNIIIFSIFDKSGSVAPVKREIKLVSPYNHTIHETLSMSDLL